MFKKLIKNVGIAMTLYYAMDWAFGMGQKHHRNKCKDLAKDYPDMTLAELYLDKEEA